MLFQIQNNFLPSTESQIKYNFQVWSPGSNLYRPLLDSLYFLYDAAFPAICSNSLLDGNQLTAPLAT